MSDYKEFQGKSLDAAIAEACAYYDSPREKLEIDIVQDAKSGIFGLVGARNALIRARRAPSPTAAGAGGKGRGGRKGQTGQTGQIGQAGETADTSAAASAAEGMAEKPAAARNKPARAWQGEARPREYAEAYEEEDREEYAREERIAFASGDPGEPVDQGEPVDPGEPVDQGEPVDPADSAESADQGDRDGQENTRARSREKGRGRPARQTASVFVPPFTAAASADRGDRPDRALRGEKGIPPRPAATRANPDFSRPLASDMDGDAQDLSLPRLPLTELDQALLRSTSLNVIRKLIEPIVDDMPVEIGIGDDRVMVSINGDDAGLLIGREGQNLAAVQYLAARIISRLMNAQVRVQVDAGDYHFRQDSRLKDMARSLADKVRATGRSLSTKPLSAYQRRVIHLTLQDDPEIYTRSSGDGALKRVVVMRRKEGGGQPSES